MVDYIRFPFAEAGDRDAVPAETQLDDAVSLQEGYPVQYQQEPGVVVGARRIERRTFNGLMHLISAAVRQYQQFGAPEFITSAQNGGVAYPYAANALVRYDAGAGERVWRSLIDNNTTTPGGVNWLDTTTYLLPTGAVTSIDTLAGLDHTAGTGAVTLGLNLSELTSTVGVGATDFLVLSLAGGANRRTTISNFLSTFITKALIDPLNINADTLDGVQASGFVTATRAVDTAVSSGLAGGGALSVDRALSVDINNLTTATALGTHELAFSQGAQTTRKTTLSQAVGAVVTAGYINGLTGVNAATLGGLAASAFVQTTRTISTSEGLSGGGDLSANRSLQLDLNGLTTATPVSADTLPFFDISASLPRKATLNTLVSAVVTKAFVDALNVDADTLDGLDSAAFVQTTRAVSTGSGLAGGGDLSANRTLQLDLNGLTTATPVVTDTLPFFDVSAGTPGKTTLTALKTALGLQNLNGNSFTGSLTATGDIGAFSDERLKREIHQVDPEQALAAVVGWRKAVVTFNAEARTLYPDTFDDKPRLAFYAQDLYQTHADLVTPLPVDNGATRYQTVAYDRTPVVLASAIEALTQRVQQLDDDNRQLHERLARLERALGAPV